MLYTIIALAVVLSYMAYKLYGWDLKNEFADSKTLFKEWIGMFKDKTLLNEFKLSGYELLETIKQFITPIKTFSWALVLTFAPIVIFVLNIVRVIAKVHKRK